jgi:hypothetical protein
MRLVDDQYEEPTAEPDVIPANLASAKAWLASEVRKAGGAAQLQDLVNQRRNDKTGPRFWQCITDRMWAAIAEELKSEWSTKRAEKAKSI